MSNWTQTDSILDGPTHNAWKYLEPPKFVRYPILTDMCTYYDGGYVEDLLPNASNVLEELKATRWLDRYSRALIIELTLLNMPTRRFNSVTIVFEFPSTGGVIPSASIFTFKMERYRTARGLITLTCEGLFVVLIIYFLVREALVIYRSPCRYISGFWNLIQASTISLSIMAIGFYGYREWLFSKLSEMYLAGVGNKFINFRLAAYVDAALTYVISLLVFFVLVKFLKLLSFHKRIFMLSRTLKMALRPMVMFSTALGKLCLAYLGIGSR